MCFVGKNSGAANDISVFVKNLSIFTNGLADQVLRISLLNLPYHFTISTKDISTLADFETLEHRKIHWKFVGHTFSSLLDAVSFWDLDTISGFVSRIFNPISGFASRIFNAISGLTSRILGAFSSFTNFVFGAFSSLLSSFSGLARGSFSLLGCILSLFSGAVSTFLGLACKSASCTGDTVGSFISSFVSSVSSVFRLVGIRYVGIFGSVFGGVFGTLNGILGVIVGSGNG